MDSFEFSHHGVKGMKWGVRKQKRNSTSSVKSTHRERLEEKYRDKGQNKKEAARSAEKRIRAERVLAIAGGVTLAAAGVYATHYHVKYNVDKIIPENMPLHRIAKESSKDSITNFNFYAAYDKGDVNKYKGLLGDFRSRQQGDSKDVYSHTIKTKGSLKIASRKSGKQVYEELKKTDPEFNKLLSKRKNAVFGKKSANGYDRFNQALVGHDPVSEQLNKKFYDALKKKGYDGVLDMNDMKYSGYNAKAPVIVFNGRNKIREISTRKLSTEEINKAKLPEYGKALAKESIPVAALFGGAYLVSEANDYVHEPDYMDM